MGCGDGGVGVGEVPWNLFGLRINSLPSFHFLLSYIYMKVDDFFDFTEVEDIFGFVTLQPTKLKTELIDALARKPLPNFDDKQVAIVLLSLLRDEFVTYGTEGEQKTNNDDIKLVLRTVKVILNRNSLPELRLPFRSFDGFYDYWHQEGMVGGGSWATRRGYIQGQFNPLIELIEDKIDAAYFTGMSTPVSELPPIGDWQRIRDEIAQLRSRYAAAKTPQDYSAVGTACVRIIEGVSRVAYRHDVHGENGEIGEPPIDKTNIRIGRVIEVGLSGRKNAELRALARSSSEVAHKVKHATTPNALQAGIASDATILLASIVQRIEQARSEEAEI